MIGPFAQGHWTALNGNGSFQGLIVGGQYVVSAPFTDFDGDTHPAGEAWTFLGSAFQPHDDGLSLFVSLDGRQEWHIRLQWQPEAQAEIIDNLGRYVQSAKGS
ncbi:DUF3601 domain-containing protein [Sphingomonas sp. AR_OL41]|jgi:hypothetical protein|uniref:DUF3601 domain-containing protein n=1 Tax=Sphingomonas sp. AR_OL41 TaxID=3042729 RepID=UPI00248115B6|nr:DUF3601 domain-containing protein [Sphingomonas sp. AR_OL41]MDH7974008.1 DUF3601 domain-containing protein [Sphingomonas sp. AR_OL41]